MTDAMETDMDPATYEELAQLDMEFDDIDTEIIAKQYVLSKETYAKRAALINRIPSFWPLVFELAPPEIDQYIQPSDSAVLASCLKNIHVTRFEVPDSVPSSSKNLKDFGEPRSVEITFEFSENEWFEDSSLSKKFWYRRAKDGYIGLVSEPVAIRWKKGKDLTEGLLDGAVKLWQAQKKAGVEFNAAEGKNVPEFEKLKKMVDDSTEGGQSFFTWFGYRGRYIGQAEHDAATKESEAKREQVKRGEALKAEEDDDDEDEELDMPELETEIFPDGDDLAISIAEDLWPSAIRYFTEAQEAEDLDSADFDSDDEDDEDDDEEDEEMTDMPDIRSLVNQKKGGAPSKKARKA